MTAAAHPATELARAIANGERTAQEVVAASLARIEQHDADLGAFCATWREAAMQRAEHIDRRRAAGEAPGALAGIPIASKDNLLAAGQRITAGSRMLTEFRAPYTATSLARVEACGGVLIGATNMDEFGMGSTTETSARKRTRNPFAADRVPGGSSGGSAAAVAADLCPLAIGSDTGGSVRQPAALCGVAGLKPSYGRVSRHGLIAYASSLDCVGAIARSARDLALWLDCASGGDPADPTSLAEAPPVLPLLDLRSDLRGVRIGVPEQWNGPGIADDVLAATGRATDDLRRLGAKIVTATLPAAEHAVAAYYLLATSEAASNLARYDGVHYGHRRERGPERGDSCIAMTTASRSEGFGPEVQLRILLGTFATSIGYSQQFYERARLARRALQRDFERAFTGCDLLLSPTSPRTAPRFGERQDDPVARYLWDALTVPASLAGLPALSIPCGSDRDGLPIGLQLMAPHLQEGLLLQIADVFQRHTDHHLVRPAS